MECVEVDIGGCCKDVCHGGREGGALQGAELDGGCKGAEDGCRSGRTGGALRGVELDTAKMQTMVVRWSRAQALHIFGLRLGLDFSSSRALASQA
jgi:hypothetical protein